MTELIQKLSSDVFEEAVTLRRELHKIPELSFCEYKTAAYVFEYLKKLGLSCRKEIAGTGVIAFLDAGKKNTLLLRADMDALPIDEEKGEFSSTHSGVMHACGHDVHMAGLLAAAKCMARAKEHLKANVLFVFQPGEETDGGALPMIETGILEEFHVTCAAGLHVMNDVEAGKIRVKTGALMAAPDDFDLEIKGKGGHGAYPESCIDPIGVAAKIILDFKALSEKQDKTNVISTCAICGGNTYNVFPDTAALKGTVRVFDETLRQNLPAQMEEVISVACKDAGATYEFQYNFRYPPLVNDKVMADTLAESAANIIGKDNVLRGGAPSMAGEDFAYFAKYVPSVFFHLGTGNKKSGIDMPLHSSNFKIDESALKVAVKTYLSLAFNDCVYF